MRTTLAALLCVTTLGVAAPALAQPHGPPPGPAMAGHDLRGQLEELERRIQDGDRQHQLDRGEFDRATRELQNIRDAERDMRLRNRGELNDYDRGVLQQRIDQLSRSIHWMRENGPGPRPGVSPPPAPPPAVVPLPAPGQWSLDQREDWIQQSINRGRADGSLDGREFRRAQSTLNDIRSTQAYMLRRGHGRLRDYDRMQLEQRLERLRASLHWMRGNGEMAPWGRH